MNHNIIVAIDGPSGAGKSSVARTVAQRLGYLYIDTGAMYRAVGLKAWRQNPALDDDSTIQAIASQSQIELHPGDGGLRIILDGEDVTEAIRKEEISQAASIVSKLSTVRRLMVQAQQAMGARGGVVMEGRDIGSKVFPQAELKVFLDANPETRARRRFEENQKRGISLPYAETLTQIIERDARDSERGDSPLIQTEDAVRVDTSGMSLNEVIETVYQQAIKKIREKERS
jgi:CMP/dCMP kinase